MKKSIATGFLLLGFLLYPFFAKAQDTTGNMFLPCANPPANIIDCVDKFNYNGTVLIEARHNVFCKDGYSEVNKECVSNSPNSSPASGAGYYDNLKVSVTTDPTVGVDGILNTRVGDKIAFTRVLSMEIGIGGGHWSYSPNILSCDEGGEPTLYCKVLAKGDGAMSYSIDVMTSWDNGKSTYQTFTAPTVKIHVSDASGTPYRATKVSQGQPDLVIKVAKSTLVTRRIKGVAKKQYKFGVTVKNVGTGDATGPITYSAFSEAAVAPIVVTKGALGAGKSKKVFLYLDTTEKGNIYTFKADPDNTVAEFDETNNLATRVVGK